MSLSKLANACEQYSYIVNKYIGTGGQKETKYFRKES